MVFLISFEMDEVGKEVVNGVEGNRA